MRRIRHYLPGSILILSGIFIVLFPEILVALFASIVIMAGIGLLYIGKRLSESEEVLKNRFGFHDDNSETYWNAERPVFRYYRRWF